MADVIFALGWQDVPAPQNLDKVKQFITSSVPSPSSADIKYTALVYEDKPGLVDVFEDFQDTQDFVKSMTSFKGTETGKQPEVIFQEKGRPNARRLLYLLVNGSSLPSDKMVSEWNKTFVQHDIVFVPVVFGSSSQGTKYKPLTPGGDVIPVDPEDPKEKGEKTAGKIAKGIC